jgi:hypothetical protein
MITTRLSSWSAVAATPLSLRLQSGGDPANAGLPPQSKTRVCQWCLWGILLAYALLGFFDVSRAQSNVVSHASDFTSVEYYPAPNQQQMKSRLSGAEAQPLPGGLLAIKQLKLEIFKPDGQPEITVIAPECVYNQLDGTASSPGRLEVQTGDGKVRVEGEGFLWRQNDSFLTISNQVRTVIKLELEKKR